MRPRPTKLALTSIALLLLGWSLAARAESSVAAFAHVHRAQRGSQHYVFGLRVHEAAARLASWVGLRPWVRHRELVHVHNGTLDSAVQATSGEGLLEVTIPRGKGHVFYRLGDRVYDFWDEGFRAQGVRPLGKGERYGVVIRLDGRAQSRLRRYFEHLERTAGAELGRYDFRGKDGFHCVSVITRPEAALGDNPGEHLVKLLGGRPKDGGSMIGFANFLLRRAKNVEGIFLYRDGAVKPGELDRWPIGIITRAQMRKARKAFVAKRKQSD